MEPSRDSIQSAPPPPPPPHPTSLLGFPDAGTGKRDIDVSYHDPSSFMPYNQYSTCTKCDLAKGIYMYSMSAIWGVSAFLFISIDTSTPLYVIMCILFGVANILICGVGMYGLIYKEPSSLRGTLPVSLVSTMFIVVLATVLLVITIQAAFMFSKHLPLRPEDRLLGPPIPPPGGEAFIDASKQFKRSGGGISSVVSTRLQRLDSSSPFSSTLGKHISSVLNYPAPRRSAWSGEPPLSKNLQFVEMAGDHPEDVLHAPSRSGSLLVPTAHRHSSSRFHGKKVLQDLARREQVTMNLRKPLSLKRELQQKAGVMHDYHSRFIWFNYSLGESHVVIVILCVFIYLTCFMNIYAAHSVAALQWKFEQDREAQHQASGTSTLEQNKLENETDNRSRTSYSSVPANASTADSNGTQDEIYENVFAEGGGSFAFAPPPSLYQQIVGNPFGLETTTPSL